MAERENLQDPVDVRNNFTLNAIQNESLKQKAF